MKKKIITLALLSLFGLVGCGETVNTESAKPSETVKPTEAAKPTETAKPTEPPAPKTFDDMYDELKKPMTVTGSAKVTLVNKSGGEDSILNNTIKVQFGETSFHIEQTGDSDSIISTVYTTKEGEDAGKALHYFITAENTVDYQVITEGKDEDKKDVLFKEYDNPFKYVDAGVFTEADGTFYVDLDDAANKEDTIFMVNNLTYINFGQLSQTNDELFEEITLKTENEQITGIHIISKEFTDVLGTTKFEWDLNFDYSIETDHSYPLPSPLETKDYHRTLKSALDKLISGEEPYTATCTVDYKDGMDPMTYQSYYNGSFVYVQDKDMPNQYFNGYVNKDNKVYQLTRINNKVYYKADHLKDNAGNDAAWTEFTPSYAIAPEWFSYSAETKAYTLTSSSYSAGAFGYKMLSLGLVDPQIAASSSVTITLSEDNSHVEKMVFGDDVIITATFTYGAIEKPFGIDISALQPATVFTIFNGSYTAKIDDTTSWTIVVSEADQTVKVNDILCTDVKANQYGEIEFTYNGANYSINARKNRLYDNTNGGSYTLTINA